MAQFPIILVPQVIAQAASPQGRGDSLHLPPLPTRQPGKPRKPKPPRFPGPPPQRWDTLRAIGVGLVSLAVAIALGMIAGLFNPDLMILIYALAPLLSVSIALRYLIDQLQFYPSRMQAYQQRFQDYEKQLKHYQQVVRKIKAWERRRHQLLTAVQKYQERSLTATSQERSLSALPPNLYWALQQTLSNDRNDSQAPRGRSEEKFERYLKKFFPGKIKTGLSFSIPDYPHPYTADFAYVDGDLNLCIDIEIDEPYRYADLSPTHEVGSEKDKKRNQFFLRRGWLVIRFSEEQVIRSPESCCKTIAKTLARVLGNPDYLKPFQSISDLQPMPQWTMEEATQMALHRSRDRYLGDDRLESSRPQQLSFQGFADLTLGERRTSKSS
ncbi:MAG: DUF559 domain-containing protein [Leptolyngbyaceae cyanobacterium bins.59]|nr:DUF559 domain-containing protein [Leptolyngbyaceae cyanobacterium bins.59]